jgi:hypothetical protein
LNCPAKGGGERPGRRRGRVLPPSRGSLAAGRLPAYPCSIDSDSGPGRPVVLTGSGSSWSSESPRPPLDWDDSESAGAPSCRPGHCRRVAKARLSESWIMSPARPAPAAAAANGSPSLPPSPRHGTGCRCCRLRRDAASRRRCRAAPPPPPGSAALPLPPPRRAVVAVRTAAPPRAL